MRRRAADFRRPVRRRIPTWIWVLLGLFSIGGLCLFVVQHNHGEDRVQQHSSLETNKRADQFPHKDFNFTQELQSATSFSRQISEQITLAKAYVIIAKENNNLQLAWKLSNGIRRAQLLLSKAAMRADPITLDEAEPVIQTLSSLIFKSQDLHYDIATRIMTMKSHIQALEVRAEAAMAQSAAFGQLVAKALPKSLHCLNLKLTTDWLGKPIFREQANDQKNSPRLVDNNLYHFCVFSDNVLAISAVVNSTVWNAEHPKQLVFHIVTDKISFGPMLAWFLGNDFKGSTVEVQSLEELSWLDPGTSLNNLRFYVPQIYPQLEKVVFLDDDVIVQKDLTPLFSLDLHGNVNGAVETCLEAFHRFYKYLNFSNPIIRTKIDPQACGWAFGVNVFDLILWRRENVTDRYRFWRDQNVDGSLWRLGTLPPGLLTFYGLTEPLDRRWHVLGLGYDFKIDNRLIESAAVIHYNGNLKPWLRLAIGRYKPLWDRYVSQSNPYIRDCVTT